VLRIRFSNPVSLFLPVLMIGFLAACDQSATTPRPLTLPFNPYNHTVVYQDGQRQTIPTTQGDGLPMYQNGTQNHDQTTIARATGKVAILLPLSGAQSNIGQPMLQAAQQALFDMNESSFTLLPFDTKGTSQGAQQAATDAANAGAQLILGPLLAPAVESAGRVAMARNLPVIGFTTDWTKAGGNVLTMGILPFDQGERLAQYAAANNLRRIAIVAPQDTYSNAVIAAFENAARIYNITVTIKLRYDASRDPARTVAEQLAHLRKGGTDFDALVIPAGGQTMTQMASALKDHGMGANNIRWLGAGVWDDPVFWNNPAMIGAVYAAPSPALRRDFEKNYQALYGQVPPRLASLAYDATALSIILMRQNSMRGGIIDRATIMNPNGFAGVDGIFRFQSNGLAERGLAMHQITSGGRSQIVDHAPNSFLTSGLRLPSR